MFWKGCCIKIDVYGNLFQITNNKHEHMFFVSTLQLIYYVDSEVENEGHLKIKPITSVNLQPLTPPEPRHS